MVWAIFQCRCGTHYLPQRYIMAFMTFLGILMCYATRNCLNIAITKMVIPRIHTQEDIQNSSYELCPYESDPEKPIKGGEYDWEELDQQILLLSFVWGYAFFNIPAGYLADIFGGKHVFATGVLISAVGSIMLPLSVTLTDGNIILPTVIRTFMGIFQASAFPASTALAGAWSPKNERSRIGSIILTGSQIGSILGNYVTAELIRASGTWAFPFYVFGCISFVWYFFYIIMVYSQPTQCPFITEDEATLLANELGPKVKKKVPWCLILKSCPVWALVTVSIGHSIIFLFFTVNYPKYLHNVLQYPLREIGIFTSTPYILLWICSNLSAVFCDYFIKHEVLSIVSARKIFTTLGSITPSVFILLLGYMGCNREAAVTCAYISITSMGPYYPGVKVNPIDLTKNFPGTVTALGNGIGNICFLPVPFVIGIFAKKYSPEEWIPILWGVAAIGVVTNIVYIIWGDAERQPWDEVD